MPGWGEPFQWKNNAGTGTNGESHREQTEPGNQEVSGHQSRQPREHPHPSTVGSEQDGWMAVVRRCQAPPGASCRRAGWLTASARPMCACCMLLCATPAPCMVPARWPASGSCCQASGAGKHHSPVGTARRPGKAPAGCELLKIFSSLESPAVPVAAGAAPGRGHQTAVEGSRCAAWGP